MAIGWKCLESVAGLTAGIAAVASGLGGAGVAVGTTISAAKLLGLVGDDRERHGPESESTLARIREEVRTGIVRDVVLGIAPQADLNAADAALAELLPECMLDRTRLAESAIHPDGFPKRAAVMIVDELAMANPIFAASGLSASSNTTCRDFALRVIQIALSAALNDKDYAERLGPHLLVALAKGIGRAEKGIDHANTKLDTVLARLPPDEMNLQPLPTIENCKPYTGSQIDFRVGTHSEMYEALARARSNGNARIVSLLHSLSFALPSIAAGRATKEQRFVLYGGYDPGLPLDFSPLSYEKAGLTFARDLSQSLVPRISDASDNFTAQTIIARPGQGKSIALAQVILGLCNVPGIVTFWSFDPKAPLECDQDGQLLFEDLFSVFLKLNQLPKRIVFVFDDLHKRPQIRDLHNFYSCAQAYAEAKHVNISFLFASSDANATITEDRDVFPLELTPADERRLYVQLTESDPLIVQKRFNTVDELIAEFPRTRDYGHDVQSFIDFIIDKSVPTHAFRANWYSDVSGETQLAKEIIALLAVSQMFDLPVPTRIALAMTGARAKDGPTGENGFLKLSHRICSVKESWDGFGLTSGYRAQNLLRHLHLLDVEFTRTTLAEIINKSLIFANDNLEAWAKHEGEYIRHVFQRLAKKQFYVIPELPAHERLAIADWLFDEFGKSIVALLFRLQDARVSAKWAGTLCSLGLFKASEALDASPECVAAIVSRLCASAARGGGAEIGDDPQAYTSLMRATNRLLSTKKFKDEKAVSNTVAVVRDIADFDSRLISEIGGGAFDAERRGNELLLSYVTFQLLQADAGFAQKRSKMFGLYDRVEREFSARGLRLDTGNLLTRADCVLIGDASDVRTKAQYLNAARQMVQSRARTQGTWGKGVETAIRKFESKHGPIEMALRIAPQCVRN